MPQQSRLSGETGEQVKQHQLREALKTQAIRYSGNVLLVPSIQVLARALGRTTGYLYGAGGSSNAAAYEHRIEEATGLHIIHKGGLVLASEISGPQTTNQFEIEMLAERLPSSEIASLIGNLAQKLASKDASSDSIH